MPKINDYINRCPYLTHAEARSAYFTMNFPKGDDATFYAGAEYVSEKIGVDDRIVRRVFAKLARAGWLEDTGKRHGRSVEWRINYEKAWNDSMDGLGLSMPEYSGGKFKEGAFNV